MYSKGSNTICWTQLVLAVLNSELNQFVSQPPRRPHFCLCRSLNCLGYWVVGDNVSVCLPRGCRSRQTHSHTHKLWAVSVCNPKWISWWFSGWIYPTLTLVGGRPDKRRQTRRTAWEKLMFSGRRGRLNFPLGGDAAASLDTEAQCIDSGVESFSCFHATRFEKVIFPPHIQCRQLPPAQFWLIAQGLILSFPQSPMEGRRLGNPARVQQVSQCSICRLFLTLCSLLPVSGSAVGLQCFTRLLTRFIDAVFWERLKIQRMCHEI